jgi:hypothetical protein
MSFSSINTQFFRHSQPNVITRLPWQVDRMRVLISAGMLAVLTYIVYSQFYSVCEVCPERIK